MITGTTVKTESLPRPGAAFFDLGDLVELHWPDDSCEVVKITTWMDEARVVVTRLEFHEEQFLHCIDQFPIVPLGWLKPVENA